MTIYNPKSVYARRFLFQIAVLIVGLLAFSTSVSFAQTTLLSEDFETNTISTSTGFSCTGYPCSYSSGEEEPFDDTSEAFGGNHASVSVFSFSNNDGVRAGLEVGTFTATTTTVNVIYDYFYEEGSGFTSNMIVTLENLSGGTDITVFTHNLPSEGDTDEGNNSLVVTGLVIGETYELEFLYNSDNNADANAAIDNILVTDASTAAPAPQQFCEINNTANCLLCRDFDSGAITTISAASGGTENDDCNNYMCTYRASSFRVAEYWNDVLDGAVNRVGEIFEFSSSGEDTDVESGVNLGEFTANAADVDVSFDYRFRMGSGTSYLQVNFINLTNPGSDVLVFQTDGSLADNTLVINSFSQNVTGLTSGDTYRVQVYYTQDDPFTDGDEENTDAAIDNFLVKTTCTSATATAMIDETNCDATYDLSIMVTDLGSSASVDILVNGVVDQTITATGTYMVNNRTGGTATTLALDTDCGMVDLGSFAGCINDICSDAVDILGNSATVNLTIANHDANEMDTDEGTGDAGEPNTIAFGNGNTLSNCASGPQHSAYWYTDFSDLWYVVDIPDGTDQFSVTFTGLTCPVAILPYSGNCGSLTLMDIGTTGIVDSDQDANIETDNGDNPLISTDGVIHFRSPDVAAASTGPIYLRIIPHDDRAAGTNCDPADINPCNFTISASAPQPNDICNSAIDIDGVTSMGDLCAASVDTENNETCNTSSNCTPCTVSAEANDLWYQVTMNPGDNDQFLEVDITFPNATDEVLVTLYSACFSNSQMRFGPFGSEMPDCAVVSSTGAGSTVTHRFGSIITEGGSGPDYYVRVVPTTGNGICDFSILGRRVAENNDCTIANETFPLAFTITNPVNGDFQYATASGAAGVAGNDLWYVFDPDFGTDANGLNIYSTSATIDISGLAADESLELVLYRRHGSTGPNCVDLPGDFLSSTTVSPSNPGGNNGTYTLDCLDEVHGTSGTGDGYILRIVQTGGAADATFMAEVTPGPLGPFNNSCINIWDGNSAENLGGPDAAHDFNYFFILDGETATGNFTGSTDCDPEIMSTDCNGNSNDVSQRDMWYIFEVPATTCGSSLTDLVTSTVIEKMNITYAANPPDQFRDAKIWIYDDCADANLLSGGNVGTTGCTTAALDGAGETHTVNGLTQGQQYLIRIKPSDLNSTLDYAFDLGVDNGAVSPCNDYVENAYSLTVNDCLDYPSLLTLSAQGANDEETFGQNDVFFRFTAPNPANGGPYFNANKSWVSVFLESVSGHIITMELWRAGAVVATAQTFDVSGVGDKVWGRFGHLDPGVEYQVRLRFNETVTTNVQYKIAVESGSGGVVTDCDANDVTASPVHCGSCGGGDPFTYNPSIHQNDHCEMWYKVDLPVGAGGAGTFWVVEVRGFEQVLDFELRSQFLSESSANQGDEDDFDHPCSSRPLEPGASLVSTTPVTYEVDPGPVYNGDATSPSPYLNDMGSGESQCQCVTGCSAEEATTRGGGFRKVYSNLNGPAAGQKDYYYIRVFMDPDDPNYMDCRDGAVQINPCQVIFRGPYSSDPTTGTDSAPGAPDLVCNVVAACLANATTPTGTDINLCAEGGALTGTDASLDAGQTDYSVLYLLVNSSNVIVDNENSPSNLVAPANIGTSNEVYTLYTLEYETAQGINITNNVTTLSTIADSNGDMIEATPSTTACMDLSTAGLMVTVYAPVTVTPTASSETCAADNRTYSYNFIISGGSGSITLSNIVSSQAGTTVSDLGGGSYQVSGIPSGGTTTISVTDDAGCTTVSAVQVPAAAVNCCGANVGSFPGN